MTGTLNVREASATRDISRWINEPALVLAGFGLLGVVGLLTGASLLRGLVSALLALFGSGFSLAGALFPRARQLDAVERAAVSAGLSLAIGGITAFLMSISPWGLTLNSFVTASVFYNLVCYGLVVQRRRNLAEGELLDWTAGVTRVRQWWGKEPRNGRWLSMALALLLLGGVATLYVVSQIPQAGPPLTEFYLLGPEGRAEGYPTTAVVGERMLLTYGIANHEHESVQYAVHAFANGALVGVGQPVRIGPEETQTAQLELVWTGQEVGNQETEIVLYRGRNPYRSLHLWIDVQPAVQATDPAS